MGRRGESHCPSKRISSADKERRRESSHSTKRISSADRRSRSQRKVSAIDSYDRRRHRSPRRKSPTISFIPGTPPPTPSRSFYQYQSFTDSPEVWQYIASGIKDYVGGCKNLTNSVRHQIKQLTGRIMKVFVQPMSKSSKQTGTITPNSFLIKFCNYCVKDNKVANEVFATVAVTFYRRTSRAVFKIRLVDRKLMREADLSMALLVETCENVFCVVLRIRDPDDRIEEAEEAAEKEAQRKKEESMRLLPMRKIVKDREFERQKPTYDAKRRSSTVSELRNEKRETRPKARAKATDVKIYLPDKCAIL